MTSIQAKIATGAQSTLEHGAHRPELHHSPRCRVCMRGTWSRNTWRDAKHEKKIHQRQLTCPPATNGDAANDPKSRSGVQMAAFFGRASASHSQVSSDFALEASRFFQAPTPRAPVRLLPPRIFLLPLSSLRSPLRLRSPETPSMAVIRTVHTNIVLRFFVFFLVPRLGVALAP
ncbi:hypothetical protein EX30DRAFT_190206 [Ascodesmis nigricans]|uniref:Uncharacterized protein n=1 Tax=Ascodesmis nigricans TaxID=341454 RepID=A0A4S2N0L3_9PEZI|nr:hypothetical protein EX30DRAFT_190206 [Ascodesmis nigricans]